MDVGKIAPKLYQYTAIDDCSRLKVIKLYFNQQAASTLDFLDQIVAEFPFPIQRIQTERGEEFYDLIDLKAPDLFEQLQQWQDYYKRDREHGSINQTPWQKWEALKAQIPTLEEVQRIYGLKKERIRDADYRVDRGKPRRVILL